MFLQAPGQFTARKNDLMFAGTTFQANISPKTDDFPLVASAWMLFTQPDYIFQVYLW
jgi:hypothetical protein